MAEITDFDTTDANNTGRWPENMAFSAVNDAGRADEGILARWFQDWNASVTASGSSNAFAITSNRTISSLVNNTVMAFTANHNIDGAATLNLNGLGAKSLVRFNGSALVQGDIISGQPVMAIYKSADDVWYVMSALAASTGNMFVDLDENASPGDPAADDARLYAKDDSTVTRLAYRDSAGDETLLLGPPARAYDDYTSTAEISTDIPPDGSVPQITEGTEILSVTITLKRASSRVRLRARGEGQCAEGTGQRRWGAALFVAGTSNALRAAVVGPGSNSQAILPIVLECEHAPGSIGPHTYSVRVGTEGSGSETLRLNSNDSGDDYGAANAATLVAEEVFVVS